MDKKDRVVSEDHRQLVEKYFQSEYAEMLSFAFYMLENHSMAEVAVQDTFMTALEKAEKFTSSPNPVGWLYNTLKFKIKHIFRDKQTLITRFLPVDEITESQLASTDDTQYPFSFPAEDPDSKLLIQFYIQGYTMKELAREYGITPGACKMRIKRAKERVKKDYFDFDS